MAFIESCIGGAMSARARRILNLSRELSMYVEHVRVCTHMCPPTYMYVRRLYVYSAHESCNVLHMFSSYVQCTCMHVEYSVGKVAYVTHGPNIKVMLHDTDIYYF